MANEGTIAVRESTAPGKLYDLIERVDKGIDETRSALASLGSKTDATTVEIAQMREELNEKGATLGEMRERLDQLDRRLPKGEKVYVGIDTEHNSAADQEARMGFARCVLDVGTYSKYNAPNRYGSGIVTRTADGSQTEGTAADGGYLVPETYANSITYIVQKYGVARRYCSMIQMTKKEHRIPTNGDLPTVYWDTELDAPELNATKGGGTDIDSKVSFQRPALVAHKLIGISSFSIELEEDSLAPLATFLVDVFGIAIARAEDAAFLVDNGAPKPFTGLFKASGPVDVVGNSGQDTFAEVITYDNLLKVVDAVDEDTVDGGVWFMSNSIVNQIRKVKDLQNRPLWGEMATDAPLSLFGRPIVRCRVAPHMSDDAVSTVCLAYGDPRFWAMGDRRMLSIDVSPHVKFAEAGLVMRIMERVAFVPVLTTPFARLKTAAA